MTTPTAEQLDQLVAAAHEAREAAYAPYSDFRVGAAVLTAEGTIVTGANVENASYGLSMCAERTAVHAAVAQGARELRAIAVAGPHDPTWPCGACRQVLEEFGPDLLVVSQAVEGARAGRRLSELLPEAFGPADLQP